VGWAVPAFGEHPAVVLSVNPINVRLGHVAVTPITGTPGPAATHVTLTADAGLTGHDESQADITGLQPVARCRFRRRRGVVVSSELAHLEERFRIYLGL
jgi:mRNA interferase MazF